MSNITVNVSSMNTGAVNTMVNETPYRVDDSIRLEARKRLEEIQRKEREEAELKRLKAKAETEAAEARIRDEKIRLLAEEEQVHILAKRKVLEAEARRLAQEREDAIQAEIQRLRNRSQVEILEDRIAALTAQMDSLLVHKSYQSRSC